MNMSANHSYQIFATFCSSDSRVKIVHSVGIYVAPLGKELEDTNHGRFFVLKRILPNGVIPL